MRKIYITSLHMGHGGVEMAITLLANALVKNAYDVEILCIYNLGEPAYRLDDRVSITYLTEVHPNREEFRAAVRGKKFIAIAKESIYAMKVLWLKQKMLADKIKEISEGAIISTRNEHSVLLSKYGNENVRKIAQLHHDHKFDKRLLRDFRKKYSNIDFFVLLTERLKEEVEIVMKNNRKTKCIVIPNFLEDIKGFSANNRISQVLAVGRLHEVKGFERLIKLWMKVDVGEGVVLKIIGSGEEKEKLKKIVEDNQLQNRVILTGALEHADVMKEMKKSLVYVMTSFSEAFPFVLVEAMMNGLPIVAYDVRVGPRAIIEEGEDGFLIPDGDETEFCEKLKGLVEDKTLWEKMSRNAVKRSQQFMEKKVIKKWLDILED